MEKSTLPHLSHAQHVLRTKLLMWQMRQVTLYKNKRSHNFLRASTQKTYVTVHTNLPSLATSHFVLVARVGEVTSFTRCTKIRK